MFMVKFLINILIHISWVTETGLRVGQQSVSILIFGSTVENRTNI